MTTAAELISDPLFQQNVVLWLAQEGAPSGDIEPLLHTQGFGVLAVGRLLSLPAPEVAALAGTSIESNRSAAPDVLLLSADEADDRLLVVECKRSSFGTASSTAKQARAMLLACGSDTAAIVGVDSLSDTLLAYLTPEKQETLMSKTLSELAEELQLATLVPGEATVLALAEGGVDSTIDLIVGSTASEFTGLEEGRHAVLRFSTATDPRPLYFFPFDPEIDQTEAEKTRCKLDLRKRLHQQLLARVGEASYPADFGLDLDALLDGAYFNLYALWDNRDAKRQLQDLARRFVHRVARVVQRSAPGALTQDGRGWRVQIGDESTHRSVMSALFRFDPETQEEEGLTLPGTEEV